MCNTGQCGCMSTPQKKMLSSTSNSLASLFKEVYDQQIIDLIPTLPNCCMCKENLLYHLNGLDHPFFHDNLEFLEWKYEQKKTLVGEEAN